MIAIVNVGEPKEPRQPDERLYEVRINRDVLFAFTHYRSDGLAKCLARAANAAQQYEMLEKITRGEDEENN